MTIFSPLTGRVLKELNRVKLQPVDAVPTMLPTWNRFCRDEGGGVGLARGWHVVLAGNTGLGKSLLALNLAAAAIRAGESVGYVSLEMSEIQLATRLQAIISGEYIRALEHGPSFERETADRAAEAVDQIHSIRGARVYTPDEPLGDLGSILSAFETLNGQGVRYFITDYMQLAWVGGADTMLRQITEVSHRIRQTAKHLDVVSIGVSQLNRSTSSGKESPIAQGLMGGSSLENDADQVLIFDHTTYRRTNENGATVDLLLSKNRHGATGKICCRWDYRTLRIEEVGEDWEEINPRDRYA